MRRLLSITAVLGLGLCALAVAAAGCVEVRERRFEVVHERPVREVRFVHERPEREVRVVHEADVRIDLERRGHEH